MISEIDSLTPVLLFMGQSRCRAIGHTASVCARTPMGNVASSPSPNTPLSIPATDLPFALKLSAQGQRSHATGDHCGSNYATKAVRFVQELGPQVGAYDHRHFAHGSDAAYRSKFHSKQNKNVASRGED